LQVQLRTLYSGKKRHTNLKSDGEDYDDIKEGEGGDIQQEEEGYESDDPLDVDGTGADVLFYGETEGEDSEVRNDGDGQPAPKWMRMTADAEIALIGLGAGLLESGRISRLSSCSSSVSSVRSAMSLS